MLLAVHILFGVPQGRLRKTLPSGSDDGAKLLVGRPWVVGWKALHKQPDRALKKQPSPLRLNLVHVEQRNLHCTIVRQAHAGTYVQPGSPSPRRKQPDRPPCAAPSIPRPEACRRAIWHDHLSLKEHAGFWEPTNTGQKGQSGAWSQGGLCSALSGCLHSAARSY